MNRLGPCSACCSSCSAPRRFPAAPQTTLGTIRGTVFDQQQNVVPGVDRHRHRRSDRHHTRDADATPQGLYEVRISGRARIR